MSFTRGLLFGLCVSLTTSVPAPCRAEPIKQDCAAYEDASIRFKCPAGWKAWFHQYSTDTERTWSLEPPKSKGGGFGEILMIEKLDGREKRPPEQILEEAKKNSQEGGFAVREGPKKVALVGADCLSFKWEEKNISASVTIRPDGSLPPLYMVSYAEAFCYNHKGNYVEISMKLSHYRPDKPDERYRKNGAIFDKFLKTVEFKQSH